MEHVLPRAFTDAEWTQKNPIPRYREIITILDDSNPHLVKGLKIGNNRDHYLTLPFIGLGDAETDPVVGAINGIVKSDGAGNISVAEQSDIEGIFTGEVTSHTHPLSPNDHAPHSDDQYIPTALSEFSDDSTHRLTTDVEKAYWNSIETLAIAYAVAL